MRSCATHHSLMLRFRLLRLRLHHWCAADAGGQRQSHPRSWSRSPQRTCPYALAIRGSLCVARSVGVTDAGSPFGLPVCTCCTSQVPAHQTHAGAHLSRRAYMMRTDAVTDTWGRCTCTDVKRWPRLCVVKEACRGERGSPCQASHLPSTHGVILTPSGNAVSQSFDRRIT